MRRSPLPYFSQWGDLACNEEIIVRGGDPSTIHDWSTDGFPSRDEYLFWSSRICGLACLRSLLHGWRRATPDVWTLIQLAGKAGALYRDPVENRAHGLFYRPFLEWISDRFAMPGEVVEGCSADDVSRLVSEEAVVMASVSSEIRYPNRPNTRRGGHLVLVHDVVDGQLVFHNPSGVGENAENATVGTDVFHRFFAGRGMVVRGPR